MYIIAARRYPLNVLFGYDLAFTALPHSNTNMSSFCLLQSHILDPLIEPLEHKGDSYWYSIFTEDLVYSVLDHLPELEESRNKFTEH